MAGEAILAFGVFFQLLLFLLLLFENRAGGLTVFALAAGAVLPVVALGRFLPEVGPGPRPPGGSAAAAVSRATRREVATSFTIQGFAGGALFFGAFQHLVALNVHPDVPRWSVAFALASLTLLPLYPVTPRALGARLGRRFRGAGGRRLVGRLHVAWLSVFALLVGLAFLYMWHRSLPILRPLGAGLERLETVLSLEAVLWGAGALSIVPLAGPGLLLAGAESRFWRRARVLASLQVVSGLGVGAAVVLAVGVSQVSFPVFGIHPREVGTFLILAGLVHAFLVGYLRRARADLEAELGTFFHRYVLVLLASQAIPGGLALGIPLLWIWNVPFLERGVGLVIFFLVVWGTFALRLRLIDAGLADGALGRAEGTAGNDGEPGGPGCLSEGGL